LSRYFDTSPGFSLRLQLDFELMRAEREKGEKISRELQPHAALNAENVEMRNLTRKSDPKKLPPFYTPDPCLQIC
jgi:plasmid maintenance system antidote protein VapI